MSPQEAMRNQVVLAYLAIVLSLLALAGAAILILKRRLGEKLRPVWVTYRSWLVMAPVVLGCVFLGRWAIIAGTALLSIFGFKEFARATGLYRDWGMTGVVYLGIAAAAAAALVDDPFKQAPGWFGLFLAMPVYAISLILAIPILRNQPRGQLQAEALAILGFIYLGWMFGHLGFLANSDNPYGYVLYILFATELNDVAAFTFGKLLGRRPFRSNISPKKTWEGALGALAVSMALPWALQFSFPRFGPLQLILTGLIVGAGGQMGDLAISVIKRDIGIKDTGAAIPGHGGILDRIDSLIFAAPLYLHMIHYFYGLR